MPQTLLQIKVYLLLTFLGLCNLNFAQEKFKSHFKNYGLNDGLPSSQVYQIIQDSKGYIWFGTDRGLVKYNGYDFETFTVDDGLSSNVIFHLDEGPNGQIWTYGKDRKLSYYEDGEFHAFKHNDTLLKCITIQANMLSFDVHEKGINLCFWDQFGTEHYFELDNDGNYRADKEINGVFIIEDEQGIRVSHNTSSLRNVYLNGEIFYEFPELAIDHSSFADVVRVGDYIYLSVGNWIMRFIENDEGEQDCLVVSLEDWAILDLESDTEGNIYIGTKKGLYKWNKEGNYVFEKLLEDVFISSLKIDQNGGVWVGSIYKGLFYCANADNKHLVQKENRILDFFSSNNHAYYTDLAGNLKGIKGANTVSLDTAVIPIPKGGAHQNEECIMFPSKSGKVTYLIDTKTNEYWKLPITGLGIRKVPKGYLAHSNLELWFYTPDYKAMAFIQFDGFLNCMIHYEGLMQMVGMDNGVKVYNGSEKTWLSTKASGGHVWRANLFPYREDEPFFQTRVNDIEKVGDSILLFASGHSGLYIENKNGNDILLNKKSGLVSNLLDKVSYEEGYIIVTSKEGVSVINEQGKIINYTSGNYLLSNDVNNAVINNDTLWVATDLGISMIVLENPKNPIIPIHLVNISVEDDEKNIEKHYELEYWESSLDVSFEALSYAQEGNLKYRYQLKGVDKQWVYSTNKSIRYPNLPAGEFAFYLSVQNGDKTWTKEKQLFTLIKKQPFWEHWLFICGMIFFGLLLAVSIIWLINRRHTRKQQNKFAVLNLERKTLQAQMSPHFIFNSLTSLQNLIIKDKKIESQEYLGSFSRLTRLALSHSTKNSIPLKEEIELLEHYIQLEKIRFDNIFSHQIKVNLTNPSITIPPMLIQPFVENAILHGLALKADQGNLTIKFIDRDETTIKCVVSDDGIGRLASKKKQVRESLGIRLIKERLSILVGEKAIEIVDLSEGDTALGTEVTIIIPIKSNYHESVNN